MTAMELKDVLGLGGGRGGEERRRELVADS